MSPFSKPELAYLQSGRRLARLATVSPDGTPHITPVSDWTVDPDSGVIEIAGRWNLTATKKFHDAARTGRAAIVIDDVQEPRRPRAVEIRGRAEAVDGPAPVICIHPERIISWGLDGDDPGARHADDAGR
jgi:pyridoxamine 5'-phosphate oxidase family protein